VDGMARHILLTLKQNGGFLPVHDKSDAEEIHALFACSKKTFKHAVGALYNQQLILLEKDGIRIQS
jgi:predicted RNA-binding protein (virulence factor B family)